MNEDAPLPLSALQLIAPPLRLISAAMWKVMLQRDVVHYGKLEETITSLCETVPGLLHYRHQARLTMGLRALTILEALRQSDPPDDQLILQELHKLQNSYIPIKKRKDQKVEQAKRNFQTLVNSLLKNAAARKQFFREEFHLHYGGNYVASLEKLLWEFLIRLDKLLPVPDLSQTVLWLSGAPAVLEECARSASQPQLLRTLLQHERCLGHLGSASLLSSTGDAILSSLSLPLSGRVQRTIRSESTHLSKRVTNPAPSSPRTTRRTVKETQSQVAPVFGCLSVDALQKNEKVARSGQEVETASEMSRNTRSKQRSCSNKNILEKDPEKEYFVGNMLVTVISQSSDSEVEEEEEEEEGSKEEINGRKGSSERANKLAKKTASKNGNGKRGQDDTREHSTRRSFEDTESQQEAETSALLVSCMKRQPRVVIPRLNDNDQHICPNPPCQSPCQPASNDSVGNSDSVMRKRKFTDLSSTPTPKKHMTLSVNGPISTCSPSIPLVLHLPVGSPDTPSPLVNSSDDIIVDSDDEKTDRVKRKEWC
ncbi:TERF1-interacting nuclear factor 2 isoform X2 [Puntigrus tetrazona]|uniref:TERF1-interacting nuclear factor 2 isoform X2 n=1 Tax=Puntigrus tetrazona TaxID=1606681 RepID=UPI001C896E2A|nr:TERF1-interacting nuclear factor 2 isoform X2 [Puntigrus tetrazona]